jgi:toxin CptA
MTDPVPWKLRLEPAFSLYLALWLATTHLMSLGVVWLLEMESLFSFSLTILLLVSLLWMADLHLLRWSGGSLESLVIDQSPEWVLTLKNGERLQARLLPDSFVKPWLLVLNYKPLRGGRVRSLVLLPDSLDRETARQLRIYLRFGDPLGQGGQERADSSIL